MCNSKMFYGKVRKLYFEKYDIHPLYHHTQGMLLRHTDMQKCMLFSSVAAESYVFIVIKVRGYSTGTKNFASL